MLTTFIVSCPSLNGQNFVKPRLGKSLQKEFKGESVTYYTETPYEPPYLVTAVPRDKVTYSSPENCFIAQFSAMLRGDSTQFFDGFSKESWNENETTPLSGEDWKKGWARYLRGKQIRMLKKIEDGQYVIIQYELRNESTGKRDLLSVLHMKIESGRWLQTQDLSKDEFFIYLGTVVGGPTPQKGAQDDR